MAETDLTIKFKVQDDGSIVLDNFSTKLAQIPKHVDSMNASLKLISISSLVNLGEQAYNTGERILGMAKETASAINDIDRAAKVANMSAREYQLMAYAAKMSDVSIEELSVGMKKLSVNMDEAQKAGTPAADKFERIGVSVKDSSGKMKGLNDIMLEIAEKFSTWEDGPRKIAIAVDLFGRSGERLIPYLNQGAAGIKKFYEEAEKMGIVLDEHVIKRGTELEDRFKRAEAAWDSFKKKLVVGAYDIVTAYNLVGDKAKEVREVYQQVGEFVPPEMMKPAGFSEQLAEAEKAGEMFLRSEEFYKRTAQPPAIVDREKDRKIYLEVNLQLMKDQESTLKRMVELQDKLNKANDDAVKIMESLGIGTKAALTQWISEDIVGQYGKLLGSKLFSTEELEAAKAKYVEALQAAETTGGWGGEFKQIEDAINKINTMKIEDTEIQKTRNELQDLQKYMQYLDSFTSKIKLDDDQIVTAKNQVTELQKQLAEVASRMWSVNIAVTGTGSSQMPIMDKIAEIYGGFENMRANIASMKANVEVSNITAQIAQYETAIKNAQTIGHIAGSFGENYYKAFIPTYQANINTLREQLNLLTRAQAAYAAPAPAEAYTPAPSSGGEIGPVSININTINVQRGEEGLAAELDDELANLWYKDRSKLKVAIKKG